MAGKLFDQKDFDYVELMAVPGTARSTLPKWRQTAFPYIIHAPHSSYGFNLADPQKEIKNRKMFEESLRFADGLAAKFIIVHPGTQGRVEESARQIEKLRDQRIVVENKPLISLFQTLCVGYSPPEIKLLIEQTGAGFCLDIVHAAKASFATGQDFFDQFKAFLRLKPRIVHVCDCKMQGCFDEHLSLGKGELDLQKIAGLMNGKKWPEMLTLETPERSYIKLTEYRNNKKYFSRLINK